MCRFASRCSIRKSNEATIMSSVSEVNVDIKDFLMSINLEQYLLRFHEFGFNNVRDCAEINDSVLLKVGISPTGHRRRILKQLQIILSKMQDTSIYANVHKTKKNHETSEDHHAPSSQNTCLELSDSHSVQTPSPTQLETVTKSLDQNEVSVENSQSFKSDDKLTLPTYNFPIPEEEPHLNSDSFQDSLLGSEITDVESLTAQKTIDCTTEEEQTKKVDLISENVSKLPSADPEFLSSPDCSVSEANSGNGTNGLLESSPPSPFFQFQGEMVVNDLYVPSSPVLTPMRSRSKLVSRPSRSFLLRHRPVPEIPGSAKGISGRKRMFQKRWVKFDGLSISYYNNDKEKYSKGIIPLSAISTVRVQGDNKFEVVTTQRTFVFRVEKEEERNDWISILLNALKLQALSSQSQGAVAPEKCGYLELRGYKAKIFTVLSGNSVWLCKNEQDFKSGLGITIIPMNVANVKQVDRTVKQSFEIITPYRSFSFTAESEKEKQEWIEAVQQSIAETLSDYEVAEKIWFNESNRSCADCKAPNPDWASINLCVVICKKCAGQHRSLGPKDSKVRSLKMDASIWSNELIELFIVIGNKRANDFWAGSLQKDEELHVDSPVEKRKNFITQKYKEGRFRKTLWASLTKEELNKALCAAVVKPDVLETMALLFSGADVMCATGDPEHSTPYLLAKKAGQSLQMEFLYHNKFSETNKKWCVLEGGFLSYYENDKSTTPNGTININEVICLAVHKEDFCLNTGPIFTFEIYLPSERAFLFGAETSQAQRKWTEAIAKHFVPFVAENLTEADYDLIGQLYYKDCHALDQWRKGWFAMDKSSLRFCLQMQEGQEDRMHLRRLQELTISTVLQNGEKLDVLLLVEKGRTLYIHGHTKLDFTVWHTAIAKAAGTDGNALQDQQLSKNDVPIIVNSCIAFVTQYGLGCKYIYQKDGDPLHVSELLESFKKDARSFKLMAGKHQLEDVTGVLKSFLSDIDDALLTKELYPYWISALGPTHDFFHCPLTLSKELKVPGLVKAPLHGSVGVQKCSEINHMNAHNLALVFSSCLFQTKGQTSEEVNVIEDLINNYVEIFEVKEDQVKQMDIENSFITKWKDTQVSQAGDLLIEVYVERKEPDCSIIIRISPVMEAEELTNDILAIKNIIPTKDDIWATFEVIENEELGEPQQKIVDLGYITNERPLHYTENVLEQVLRWSSLAEPGSAYLVVKRFLTIDTVKHYNERKALESIKEGVLKIKEEPSKILSGNKFQDRYFVLRDGYLFLYKDMKTSVLTQPRISCERFPPLPHNIMRPFPPVSFSVFKFGAKYLNIYHLRLDKSYPMNHHFWGLTAYSEKHLWHLCCDSSQTQMEWMANVFIAQHESDIWPPAGKERKRSITKTPKIGGLPLIPIQHEKNATQAWRDIESAKAELERLRLSAKHDQEPGDGTLRERASIVAQCLEHKDEKLRNRTRKHWSFNCLEDTEAEVLQGQQKGQKGLKTLRKTEDRNGKATLDSNNKLPPKVIEELSVVLQRARTLPKESQPE
ncbi:hypothetical protein EI555_020558 [Monodon monoceros]|uniref:Arf-GAP with Rho-GAP domain, ANK repeat and PH domain-containing protein 2 n=1 Tax=Monodon monoceros TaxID=40151 RepID=A0A4U1F7E1_MONMO|nr:hypothetical protein EI555_020558 [Monodon monoceros]